MCAACRVNKARRIVFLKLESMATLPKTSVEILAAAKNLSQKKSQPQKLKTNLKAEHLFLFISTKCIYYNKREQSFLMRQRTDFIGWSMFVSRTYVLHLSIELFHEKFSVKNWILTETVSQKCSTEPPFAFALSWYYGRSRFPLPWCTSVTWGFFSIYSFLLFYDNYVQ